MIRQHFHLLLCLLKAQGLHLLQIQQRNAQEVLERSEYYEFHLNFGVSGRNSKEFSSSMSSSSAWQAYSAVFCSRMVKIIFMLVA